MGKIIIISDSNSGITQQEAKELGIFVIPMPFTMDGKEYEEENSITQAEFYEKLNKGANVTTSQPSEYYLENLWNDLLKEYDEILYIPMSSGLSATCGNAINFAKAYGGKVQVVDNLRISVTLKESVYEAIALAKEGKSATEIKKYLEETKQYASIYITLSVLKYLKKGGRISPAAAMLGDILRLKPILYTRGGKFEKYALALSVKQAEIKMINKIKSDLEGEFKEQYESGKMTISVAHTLNEDEAQKFAQLIKDKIPRARFRFINPLSLSIACHIGPGSIAVATSINNFF